MTKGAALQTFFNGFSVPAYPVSSVPEKAEMPYLTYTPVFDAWGGYPVSLTVNLWYLTEGEAEPSAKAQEISDALGTGGITLPCDGGYIWLTRGSPWCQSLTDSTNASIKRRYLNITAEYLTLN